MLGDRIPFPTRCEACGEEIPELVAQIRSIKLQTGQAPTVPKAWLRPAMWCEPCIKVASAFVGGLRNGSVVLEELAKT